jgi:hypothetical protein
MLDINNLEDMIANSEPLESFELDDVTDQEEIMHALKEMLDRELH